MILQYLLKNTRGISVRTLNSSLRKPVFSWNSDEGNYTGSAVIPFLINCLHNCFHPCSSAKCCSIASRGAPLWMTQYLSNSSVYNLLCSLQNCRGKGCGKHLSQNGYFTWRTYQPKTYTDHNAQVWLHTESNISHSDWWATLLKTPNVSRFFISTVQLCCPTFKRAIPASTKQVACITIQHCLL